MKNQPNEMVTLEWLLPLFNQQLSQLSDGWQVGVDSADVDCMTPHYHQISGALVMANLPLFATIADKLSLLAGVSYRDRLSAEQRRKAQFAHQLLQHELTQYVQIGSYRGSLIDKTVANLTQILAQIAITSEQMSDGHIASSHFDNRLNSSFDGLSHYPTNANQEVTIAVPVMAKFAPLQAQQYQQLLTVWRQQIQKLLADNSNLPPELALLERVSHYLCQSIDSTTQQRLWYVTELWLNNLAQNQHPLPVHYASILADLEQVIETYRLQTEKETSQTTAQMAHPTLDSLSTDCLSSDAIEGLIVDIYIQLSGLAHIGNHAQTLLSHLPQSTDATLRFLPRILSEIEAIIFALDQPLTLIEPLQQIKRQLSLRGWTLYESQISQVLADLTHSVASETTFAQMQWQIEQQLQELYSAIYQTEQAIRTKIGDATSFVATTTTSNLSKPLANQSITLPPADDALRQLRIAVEDIKHHFNDYVQRHQTYLLPTSDAFLEIGSAFDEMGLSAVRQVTDKLGASLSQLVAHNIQMPSWELTQALAEGLSAIELLLDYLAQQVFDQSLLAQANKYVDDAAQWLEGLIHSPVDSTDESCSVAALAYASTQRTSFDVVRYDDNGEIAPNADDVSTHENTASGNDNLNTDNLESHDSLEHEHGLDSSDNEISSAADSTDALSHAAVLDDATAESAALQAARTQLKPDSFEIDEEIREIFIEEASEVIADLEDFLPIWQQDSQDLTPLTEVRRGFHTLKGSGRMVGAFSISEMSWAIETLLNRVLDNTLAVTDDMVGLVMQTTPHLTALVADYTAQRSPSIDAAITILHSNNLLSGLPLNEGISESDLVSSDLSQDDIDISSGPFENDSSENHNFENGKVEDKNIDADIDKANVSQINNGTLDNPADLQITDLPLPSVLAPFVETALLLPSDTQDADPDIKAIFIEEAEEVLAEIIPLYEQWQHTPQTLSVLPDIRRGFHTLKGSGRMVGANHTGELAWSIENMLNRILDHSVTVSVDIVQLIGDVLSAYPALVNTFAENHESQDGKRYPAIISLWVVCAQAYSKQLGDDFSYPDLYAQWIAQMDSDDNSHYNISEIEVTHTAEAASVDKMLQTMHSVNEIMAEAPAVIPIGSEEEQAFCEIFVDEAQPLLQNINDFVSDNQHQSQIEVSDDIVRAFHTLRAASGSSALTAISDVSATIEQSLEQLQKHDTLMNNQHLQALTQSAALIESYLNAYEHSVQQQSLSMEANPQSQQDLVSLQAMLGESDDAPATDNKLNVAQLLATDIDALLESEWQLNSALSHSDLEQVQDYIQQQREQIARLANYTVDSTKFTLILGALEDAYRYIAEHPESAQDEAIQAALLAGHAQLIGLFDALAGSMSLKINAQVVANLQAFDDHDIDNSSDDPSNSLPTSSATSATQSDAAQSVFVSVEAVKSTQADELQLEAIDTDVELLEIFLEEAQELDSSIAQIFSKWRADIYNIATLKILQRHLHTIKGGARMAGIRSIGDLTHEAESVYEAFVEARLQPTEQWLTIMQTVQDMLSLQIDYVVRYQESFYAHELIEQLQQLEKTKDLPATVTLILPALQYHMLSDSEEKQADNKSKATEVIGLDVLIAQSWTDGLPDPDILEVFLEEAEELIASSNKYLQLFLSNISDIVALQALQRDLHTIKGGARMVAANGIADLAHQMETVYEELAIRRRPATKMIAQLLVTCHDWLSDAIFVLKHQLNPPMPSALVTALQKFSKDPDSLKDVPIQSLQIQLSAILADQSKQEAVRGVEDISQMPPMSGSFVEQEQSSANNEMIRISGSLIERMINLSGESAINRARIDMGMSSLTNSIEEMGTTVQRLADQLRRMEIELEAQILSQIDDADLIADEDFDPLEMDQYSALNQLSKSLTESASDLIDINSTLLEKTRDSENLLLQLSRTQTELQDGLMNSRMVPFERLTPRLERIVRQTANELNKSVELTIVNADDEMDRTILERITSPLEHMLRNAVDHGIESPQTRLNAGKDRSGHIRLEVLREGSEVVIHLTDDGRGINVEAVRNKAISQGLIDADDTSLSEIEVMQYIFNAGLTTTKQVTQISGRGVGMDVVISEIRQLGGVVSVTSDSGQGSRFTMRVPLTVAVSDALVVRAADRYYAIPLVQIERVVRINPENLYDYYKSGRATMHIEEADYRVRYLNDILTGNKLNELVVNTNTSLPVIIVKNRAGQNLALQVDQIAGSRIEVVVKPLGRQLSHLAGISAATIMGDGSVMLILDLIALLRNAPALKEVTPTAGFTNRMNAPKTGQQLTILVVDDSVTVRKVTSRFLERQGITALVAKDGIDALEILQELTPDLILLDIEMPRMDGFEVAIQVRHNKRLQNIPIIMITSRTGEKHRERAFEIGVDDYMGKPYQENELFSKIQALLGTKISSVNDG